MESLHIGILTWDVFDVYINEIYFSANYYHIIGVEFALITSLGP